MAQKFKKIFTTVIASVMILSLLSLTACGESVVGKWQDASDSNNTVEFKSDGTGTMNTALASTSITYKVDGNNLTITDEGESTTWGFTFDDGDLMLSKSDSTSSITQRLTKIK